MGSDVLTTGQARVVMKVLYVSLLLCLSRVSARLPNIFAASLPGQELEERQESFFKPQTFIREEFYEAPFGSPDFQTFHPLRAIKELFPDHLNNQISQEDDIRGQNELEIVLGYTD